jgi:hypothetical protein
MKRNFSPRSIQNGRQIAVSLGIFIFLSHLTALPVLAQDLDLDLPVESGPAGARPPSVAPGKPAAEAKPGDTPKAEAAPEAPQEIPQVEYKRKPLREKISKMQDRLLNLQTGDLGLNSTTIVGRVQLSTEYRDRRDGSVQLENVARVDIPIASRFLLRADVPHVWFDPNTAGGSTQSGFGDVFFRVGGQIWRAPEFTVLAGTDIIFPSASHSDLGRGKYQVGPGVAVTIPIAGMNSVLQPSGQHIVSIGGDPSRNDVNYSRMKIGFDTPWGQNWWTTVEPNFFIDWTQNAKTALNLEFEVGRKLGDHFRLWLRPAVGLWGTGVPGAYDWYTQVGIRYMF